MGPRNESIKWNCSLRCIQTKSEAFTEDRFFLYISYTPWCQAMRFQTEGGMIIPSVGPTMGGASSQGGKLAWRQSKH